MITAVDTNILLDILIPNARYAAASQRALEEALAEGALVISEVVYAELASQFPSPADLEHFLADAQIRLEHSPPQALQKAGAVWKAYVKSRGGKLRCPHCGREQPVSCVSCGETIAVRQHILSDFLVGAHALGCADRLLTRDLGYYRAYFQDLKIVSPR
jgi:predicted nucleic acid-binding protein